MKTVKNVLVPKEELVNDIRPELAEYRSKITKHMTAIRELIREIAESDAVCDVSLTSRIVIIPDRGPEEPEEAVTWTWKTSE